MSDRSIGWLAVILVGCTHSSAPDDPCVDGKCDLPTDPAEVSCRARRADAFNPNRASYTENFLRWSCADVAGVTLDDRGQEYCEYFAITKLPDQTQSTVLGVNLGPESAYGTSPVGLKLDATSIAALEAKPDAVVGQCVFTSWNSDIETPPPACTKASCPDVLGVPVDAETFRMRFDVNSAEAAQLLVEDCLTLPQAGSDEDPTDPRHDAFMRGCLWDADVNATEFRKSDTTICASMTRSAECGCSVAPGSSLGELISPYSRRGFPLAGWTDFKLGDEAGSRLPANCRYVALGDNSQTVVACDLTASELVDGASDVKATCAAKYADSIVVHVPIPQPITCRPEGSPSPYAGSCSATPWVVTPY